MQKRFTVREAARATGVNRTTIQHAVRTGRLTKGNDGLIALQDLLSAGFHLLSDSAAIAAHIQQLTNENQKLQEEKSQLIQLLEHQDALLRTRGNAGSPVRQIDLPTMPDSHTTYDIKAVPPAVRLPTDEHYRLTPLARQYILGALLFPDASNSFNESRQAWLISEWATIVSELIEDAAASPLRHRSITIEDLSLIASAMRYRSHSINAEAQEAFQRGFMAGAVLFTLVQMKKSGKPMSASRAYDLIANTFGRRAAADQFPLVTRTSPESLRRDWEAFSPNDS